MTEGERNAARYRAAVALADLGDFFAEMNREAKRALLLTSRLSTRLRKVGPIDPGAEQLCGEGPDD